MDERMQALMKDRDEWQKKAMRYEKAMNQNNTRAQKAEDDLHRTKRQLARLRMNMEAIVRTAMSNAIDITLQSAEAEAQKGREE